MTDEELAEWAEYGRSLVSEDHPAHGWVFGEDIVNLWRVMAEVAQRHLDGVPEPVEPEAPLDLL